MGAQMEQGVLTIHQAIHHVDVMSRIEQMLAEYRAEITGPAGDEDLHSSDSCGLGFRFGQSPNFCA